MRIRRVCFLSLRFRACVVQFDILKTCRVYARMYGLKTADESGGLAFLARVLREETGRCAARLRGVRGGAGLDRVLRKALRERWAAPLPRGRCPKWDERYARMMD